MRPRSALFTACFAAVAIVALHAPAAAPAEEPAWHASLEKGVEAAKRSGRPLFLVTIWKTGV
jgi:hypothetical protein